MRIRRCNSDLSRPQQLSNGDLLVSTDDAAVFSTLKDRVPQLLAFVKKLTTKASLKGAGDDMEGLDDE